MGNKKVKNLKQEKKEIPEFLKYALNTPGFLKLTSFPENVPSVIMDSYGGLKKIMGSFGTGKPSSLICPR